jgi:NitT/TauT family transport system substrate-binding protein
MVSSATFRRLTTKEADMIAQRPTIRLIGVLTCLLVSCGLCLSQAWGEPAVKKVRLALPSTNVTFAPIFAAVRKGFYKDEGLDVEIILMRANLASSALLTGDIDYNGAVTGVIGGAVKGQPLKAVFFASSSPMMSMIGSKSIHKPDQVHGKRIATSSPGGTATLVVNAILKKWGMDPGKDASMVFMGRDPARFAALESGVVDVAMLSVPNNIRAQQQGYPELAFAGDFIRFPQNGFGVTEKKIKEHPDEIYHLIRATMKGLKFVTDKNNRAATIDLIMRQWKIPDRKLAAEMYRYMTPVMSPDAEVNLEGLQILVDQQRENAKVARPIKAASTLDYSFVERARKSLGMAN